MFAEETLPGGGRHSLMLPTTSPPLHPMPSPDTRLEFPIPVNFRPLYFVFTFGLGAVGASGMDLNNLVERSPFASPGVTNVEPVNEAPAQLEFRGIATDDSGTIFSVYDLTASRGYWVREGESGAVTVKSYDSVSNQLVVEQGGRMVPLQLKRASIQAGAAMPVAAVPMPGNASGGSNNRPTVNPAADTQRLEAVAAEVRRRRALRNAAQTGAQPAAPATP